MWAVRSLPAITTFKFWVIRVCLYCQAFHPLSAYPPPMFQTIYQVWPSTIHQNFNAKSEPNQHNLAHRHRNNACSTVSTWILQIQHLGLSTQKLFLWLYYQGRCLSFIWIDQQWMISIQFSIFGMSFFLSISNLFSDTIYPKDSVQDMMKYHKAKHTKDESVWQGFFVLQLKSKPRLKGLVDELFPE